MVSYNIFQWILFFYIYCVFGWIFESSFVSIKSKRFVNRGFLKGPMIPIYGEGAIMMVIATTPVRGNIVLEYMLGLVGATALEYFVGALMEQIFKVKYWDYSKKRFNIKGYICLRSSLFWGVLSVLLAEVMHVPVEGFVLSLSTPVLIAAVAVITIIFTIDAVTSAKEAWDLRTILIAVTRAKEEVLELQKQLSEIKEELTEQFAEKKEDLTEQFAEKREEFTEQLNEKKILIAEQLSEKKDEITDSIKFKLEEAILNYQSLSAKLNIKGSRIIKRNPGATSKRFYEAIESVKQNVEIKRK